MNNSSHTVEPNEVQNKVYAMFLVAVSPLAIVANGMVMEVIRRKGNSKKTNDIFILNLAVSDLLYGLSMLSYSLYLIFFRGPTTTAYCKILPPFQTVIYFVSIITLVSMATERHYVILNPFNTVIRKKWLKLWLFMIWFLSTVFVLPYVIVSNVKKSDCVESWPSHTHRQVYTDVLFVLQFPLPLLIIMVCYVKIGIFLARYKPPGDTHRARNEPDMRVVLQRKITLRVTKTVAAIIVLFVLMNLPQQLGWIILDFGSSGDKTLAFLLIYVALYTTSVHSFTNAIVYGILLKPFRKDLTRIIYTLWNSCRCLKRNARSKSLRGREDAKQNQVQLQNFVNIRFENESFPMTTASSTIV